MESFCEVRYYQRYLILKTELDTKTARYIEPTKTKEKWTRA